MIRPVQEDSLPLHVFITLTDERGAVLVGAAEALFHDPALTYSVISQTQN